VLGPGQDSTLETVLGPLIIGMLRELTLRQFENCLQLLIDRMKEHGHDENDMQRDEHVGRFLQPLNLQREDDRIAQRQTVAIGGESEHRNRSIHA
jgi:hypothetical protein